MAGPLTRQEFAEKLATELGRQLEINAKLGETLLSELERTKTEGRPMVDREGNLIGTSKTPDRDWSRAYGHYRGTNATMLLEDRERTKMRLLQEKQNPGSLTDDEYNAELQHLALESVRGLSADEFVAEAKRRGLDVPAIETDDREDS